MMNKTIKIKDKRFPSKNYSTIKFKKLDCIPVAKIENVGNVFTANELRKIADILDDTNEKIECYEA